MAVTFLTNEDNVLLYTEQTLTDEQKAQARENIGALDSSVMEKGTASPNMFNINDSRIQVGVYPSGSYANPSYSEASGYCSTHPIYFEKGVTYKWVHQYGSYGAGVKIATIDPDTLELINGYFGTSATQEGEIYYAYFTAEVTGYHIIGTVTGTRLDDFMVCKADEYPEYYMPYGETLVLADDVRANDAMKSYPLWGKKITLNGDSLCATPDGGYGAIIADRNNMVYQNISRGGATITAEQYSSVDGSARHWISRTIANMDANADYVILEGGVNDASLGVPMGTITSNFSTALDDTTFCGAFESMLKQLITRFAGKKIGYIAVHKMTTNFRSDNDPDDGTSYYWAAKKCCEKWGVPFLDLNVQVPAFAYFGEASGEELYALRTTYTQNGDGWHPTADGFKKYYCDKIEAWMKTL